MTLQNNVFGHRYDDAEPCFLSTLEGNLWNRITKQWTLGLASLDAKRQREGKTWAPREIGVPSLGWQIMRREMDYNWGPGLDDTEALPSEVVDNGEDWTGAPVGSIGPTPPTGWTDPSGNTTYRNFSGTLNIYADPVLGGTLQQTLTGTPGEYYVVEILVEVDTTGGCAVGLDGIMVPLGKAQPDGGSSVKSFSFKMPDSGSVVLDFTLSGGAIASIGHVRCFLESELTGASATSGGTSVPAPVPNPINGPYNAFGTEFWIHTDTCKVGFDVDSDPEADVWLTGYEVCDSDIEDRVKLAIHAQLLADGCPGLPCTTQAGNLSKAAQQATIQAACEDVDEGADTSET